MSRSAKTALLRRDQHAPRAGGRGRERKSETGRRAKFLFITGAGTGVGKTVITTLLLHFLRSRGVDAVGLKPFSSGSRADARALRSAQRGRLRLDEINPYHFCRSVTPMLAARMEGRSIPLRQVRSYLRAWERRAECVLVEGAGGLLSPLGEGYALPELMRSHVPDVLIVGLNRLGVLHHVLVAVRVLARVPTTRVIVALVSDGVPDASTPTNASLLRELAEVDEIVEVPFCGLAPIGKRALAGSAKKSEKTLARILDHRYFRGPLPERKTPSEKESGAENKFAK